MNVKVRGLCIWAIGGLLLASLLSAADLRVADAAKQGNREAVRSLLNDRADVNASEPDGTTALHWAVHRHDLEMTDLLIRAGADVNAANEYGVTPLSVACSNGNSA
ncbi:MAG: ankyrin repeat domain-containing protein, partial [Terriglobia bacterium]